MGIFKGSKDKRKGTAFVLEDTGIEGRASGLSAGDMIEALKGFAEIGDLQKLQSGMSAMGTGDIMQAMTIVPELVASMLLKGTGGDANDQDEVQGIIDLPAPDLEQLFSLVVDATFKGKTPQDFFAGFAKKLGIDGISTDSKPQALPGLPGGIALETSSPIQPRIVPEDEAAEIRGL